MANAPDTLGTEKVWELRTTHRFAKYKVRVWSKSDTYRMGPDERVLVSLKDTERKGNSGSVGIIISNLEYDLKGDLSAVEVIDPDENGVCYYPDWP